MHTLFSLRLIFTSQINHDIIASHRPPLLQENRHGCFNTLRRLWASDNQWRECQTSWHLTCLTWSAVLKHLKKASGTTAEKVNTPVTAVNQQCLTCQRMTDGHLFFLMRIRANIFSTALSLWDKHHTEKRPESVEIICDCTKKKDFTDKLEEGH